MVVSAAGNILNPAQARQLSAIQSTARLIDTVQERLATGKAVNRALDDPDNFFSSRALDFRASDLIRRLDGIGQNIRAVQVAETGLEAALRILDEAEAYLTDIADRIEAGEITFDTQPNTGVPPNVTQIRPAAGDFVGYAGSQDSGGPVAVSNGGADFTLSGNLWKRVAVNYTVTADTVLEFEFQSGAIPEIAAIGFDNDASFGNDNDRFFLYGTQLGGLAYSAPIGAYQYDGSGNYVQVEIPIGTFFTGTFSHMTFINDDDSAPLGESTYRNVNLREGPVQTLPDVTAGSAALEAGYQTILNQLDLLVQDTQYRGINLLDNEDMTTIFNESGTSRLITEGVNATSQGLGLLSPGISSLEAVQFKIERVQAARETLRQYVSTLAADLQIIQTRESFTRDAINTLETGRDGLILDDANATGAEMLALQVRQQIQFATLATRQTGFLDA